MRNQKIKQIELPSALVYEEDPKIVQNYIRQKLQDLESIAYEIQGIDNILTEQTLQIRGMRPSSADAYNPKIQKLKTQLHSLKSLEKDTLDFQRQCSNEIENLAVSDKKIMQNAQNLLQKFNKSIVLKQFPGSMRYGKAGKNGANYREFALLDLYQYYQDEGLNVNLLIKEEAEFDVKKGQIEKKSMSSDVKQESLIKQLRNVGKWQQSDYAVMSADIIKQNNWINYLESKVKEVEFKKMLNGK